MQRRILLIGLTGVLFSVAESRSEAGDEWPQWRGAHRDGVSPETGLLKTWPPGGPQTLWRFQAGEGFSAISVDGGRAFTMFARDGAEYVIGLDAETGKEIWRFESDEIFEDHQGGHGPRSTPAIDGGRVFAVSARGRLTSLNAESGRLLWECDLKERFGGKTPRWGFCALSAGRRRPPPGRDRWTGGKVLGEPSGQVGRGADHRRLRQGNRRPGLDCGGGQISLLVADFGQRGRSSPDRFFHRHGTGFGLAGGRPRLLDLSLGHELRCQCRHSDSRSPRQNLHFLRIRQGGFHGEGQRG